MIQNWPKIARTVWVALTLLTLVVCGIGIIRYSSQLVKTVDQRSLDDLGLSAQFYVGYLTSLYSFFLLFHVLVGAIIFWLRRDELIALFVSIALIMNGAIVLLSYLFTDTVLNPFLRVPVLTIIYLGLVSSIILLFVFPDGRFVPSWTKVLALLWVGVNTFGLFFADTFQKIPLLPQFLSLCFYVGVGVYAQIHRYALVSGPVERQQTKWAILGLMAAALSPFAYFLPTVFLPAINQAAVPSLAYQRFGPALFSFSLLTRLIAATSFSLLGLLFPVSFAIAILRYRLWDIDIIINRTLVYGALTGTLAVIYLASVVLFQQVLGLFIPNNTELSIVASTLVIVALSSPLTLRIQNAIDRRFYRRKYDAARTLNNFSAGLRAEVDLYTLSNRLVSVVQETMQPENVSLWVKLTPDGRWHTIERNQGDEHGFTVDSR